MDLYADLPKAKGSSSGLTPSDSNGNELNPSNTSSVWNTNSISQLNTTNRNNGSHTNPTKASSSKMLPSVLTSGRNKSPARTNTLLGMKPRGMSVTVLPKKNSNKSIQISPHNGLKSQFTSPESKDLDPTRSMSHTHFFQSNYKDEYDPARPNSYVAYCDERLNKKKVEQVKIALERRQREQEKEENKKRLKLVRDVEAGNKIDIPSAGRGRGMTMPAWMRKKVEENASKVEHNTNHDNVDTQSKAVGQFENALERTGQEYHSSTQEITSKISEVINERCDSGHKLQEISQNDHRDVKRQRQAPLSRVVLLLNMVEPDDVDDELQDEVKSECAEKYGPVHKCLIYQSARGEPVRIFVEFHSHSDAQKALTGLHGRYFDGRQVKAVFYDQEKYDRLELMA